MRRRHAAAGSQMIALFHDDPAVDAARSAAIGCRAHPSGNAPGPDGLVEQRIPAGRYAHALHKGGYEGLPGDWAALKKDWLPTSGHRMGSPSYEVYLNDPRRRKRTADGIYCALACR